ncbi:MAG: alpha/beta hydrolase family protein [Agriterribacter sp.]
MIAFKRNKLFIICLLFCIYQQSHAAIVDTVETTSTAMHKNIKAVVIRPDDYAKRSALPVVYLLHGYSGNYADWINKAKGFEKMADEYGIMIVCPDGAYGSWYWDSPVDSSFKYETYVATELVKWVDSKYKTIKDTKARAITGLSMGGHGALYLAFKHQDVFGAAGSMSGGVDIRPFPNNWDMAKRLGSYAEYPERWEKNTVINMLYLLRPSALQLIIDCGTDDFFYKVNANLHQQLLLRNIPHDYIERPGAHDWNYWTNAVQYQLLFFHRFFEKK